jgi:hypothetical protein
MSRDGNDGLRRNEAKTGHSIEGVKRVLIADELLDRLGELQRQTRPKLDMRYWVEAAILAAINAPDAKATLESAAKERLRRELDAS